MFSKLMFCNIGKSRIAFVLRGTPKNLNSNGDLFFNINMEYANSPCKINENVSIFQNIFEFKFEVFFYFLNVWAFSY